MYIHHCINQHYEKKYLKKLPSKVIIRPTVGLTSVNLYVNRNKIITRVQPTKKIMKKKYMQEDQVVKIYYNVTWQAIRVTVFTYRERSPEIYKLKII